MPLPISKRKDNQMLKNARWKFGSIRRRLHKGAHAMNSTTVVIPEHVREDIRRIVAASPRNDETGVSLFGVAMGERRVVLAAVGPGPRATHTPVFYQPDVDYANV